MNTPDHITVSNQEVVALLSVDTHHQFPDDVALEASQLNPDANHTRTEASKVLQTLGLQPVRESLEIRNNLRYEVKVHLCPTRLESLRGRLQDLGFTITVPSQAQEAEEPRSRESNR